MLNLQSVLDKVSGDNLALQAIYPMTSQLVCARFFHNPMVSGKFANKKSYVINFVIPKPSLFFSCYAYIFTLTFY